MNQTIRLNKYLANAGISSRRSISLLLEEKDIRVNNQRVKEPGVRIDPQNDIVTINGKKISSLTNYIYIAVNKPKKVISTSKDELGRKTVLSLVKSPERVYPVGRLDENTTGLILLTNDGELTNKLTHPKFHAPKKYQAVINQYVEDFKIKALEKGVFLKEGKTAPAQVQILEKTPKKTVLEITIHEGRYHQVRRMLSKLKLNLVELKRVAIGPLELGELGLGQSRVLTEEEVLQLRNSVAENVS